MTTPIQTISQNRGWLIAGGILSILVGFFAIGSPLLFSIVIVQFLGIFLLVGGVISLGLAIFSKHVVHRIVEILLAIIRIIVGIILLRCIASSVAVITLILAIFFVIEGITTIFGSLKMGKHAGTKWMLFNGIVTLILGGLIYAQWPSSSGWVLGLFYGINMIFWGTSLLAMSSVPRTQNS